MFLFHLIHSAIMFAGAVAISLPGSESIDAGLLSEGSEGSEGTEGQESTEGQEGTESQEGIEGSEGTDGTKPGVSKESKVDWRTVPQNVKAHIQELSKTDKTLSNLLQNAVYTSQTMLKEFPGGLKEAQALKSSIEEFGGLEEIRSLSETHNQFVEEQESLDNQAREGNPEVLTNLVNIAGKEGFGKLMVPAIDMWAQSDPAAYSHVMSRVIVNTMRESGVVAEINTAFKMLSLNNPEATKEAIESLKRVATWANDINKVATIPPEKPAVDPKIQEQQQSIDNQKVELFNKEFSNSFGSWRNRQIQEQVKAHTNGRVFTDYQMKTLGQNIVQEVQDILTSDPEYMKSLNKIYATRDMAELQKFTRARTSRLLPEATKKAYRALFSDPGKKTTAKPGTKTTAKPGTAPVIPIKGWRKVEVSKAPTPDQIDSAKTPFEMKFRQQAILKDGTKVYWGKHIPKD